jgi:hypothetical protein
MPYKKKQWRPPSKENKKRGENLSPRNRKACHSVSTALLKSVEIKMHRQHNVIKTMRRAV